jgi:LPXTG-motif cell wall-anchored protein
VDLRELSSPSDDGEPSAAAKYNTAARPRDTPAWVLPVTAVSIALGVGLLAAGVLLLRRRRQRGW